MNKSAKSIIGSCLIALVLVVLKLMCLVWCYVYFDYTQVTLPSQEHGLFYAMRPIHNVDNAMDYNDELYEYMAESWSADVYSTELFGHHLTPVVTIPYDGHAWGRYQGNLSVDILCDESTGVPYEQSAYLMFYCNRSDNMADVIVETVDDYLGVRFSHYKVSKALQNVSFGEEIVLKGPVKMQIAECNHLLVPQFKHEIPPHVSVSVTFKDSVVPHSVQDTVT